MTGAALRPSNGEPEATAPRTTSLRSLSARLDRGFGVLRNHGGVAAAAALSALLAAVTSPLWLGHVIPIWDALDFYYPAVAYVSDSLREGRFPLWDPYSGAGEPFQADPQKLVLNPVVLLLGRFVPDPLLSFVLVWLVHWWWAAIGMIWIARRFGASASAALLAGGSYALSGFFVSHAEHTTFLFVAAWLPWTIGLADAAVARRSAASALLAAAALGASGAFGGYPMLVAFTGLASAVWLLLRFVAFPDRADAADRRVAARWTAGTLAVMAAVLVLAWGPILHAFMSEAAVVTNRLSAITPERAMFGEPFTLRAALSLFFPFATIFLAGNGVDMSADVSMTNAYIGFATVPLAVTWAWISLRERRRSGWLLAFAAFMVLVSLGGVGGIRILLHYVFPPLRHMRFNAAFRLYWIFSACLAAGLGLTLVVQREAARRVFLRVSLAWLGVAAAAAASLWLWIDGRGIPLGPALPSLFIPVALAGPSIVAVAAWMSRRPSPLGGALVAAIACLDVAAGLHVNHFTAWTKNDGALAQIQDARSLTTTTAGNPRPRLARSLTGSFNAHLILKIPVLGSYTSFTHPDLSALAQSRFVGTLCGPVRFWLVPGGEPSPGREAALAELVRTGPTDPVPVFVDGGGSAAPRVVPATYGDVAVETYRPEEVVLRVNVPPAGGLLTSVERYTPGWKVSVDGRPAAALRTNLLFRGVLLEPGSHRVVWRYEPAGWWPLVAVSAATLALAVLGAAALAVRSRRPRPADPTDDPQEAAQAR